MAGLNSTKSISGKLKNATLAVAFVLTQFIVPASSIFTGKAYAANNGTLKIHEAGTPSGTESNDPKVCSFNVEGFGFDASQSGYLVFDVQGGDGPTGVPAGPFAFGPTNGSGYYASQYFDLHDGHYKATLYGKQLPTGELQDEKAKSKVFKVTCPEIKPTITTQASASQVSVGDSVHDTATLIGDNNHGAVTGTVNFYLCGPFNFYLSCAFGGSHIGSGVSVSNGQAVSDEVQITQPGKYCFRASYDAPRDSKYKDVTHTNATTECFEATNRPQPQGSITVIKDAQPNSSQLFNFTTSGTGLTDFSLTDDGSDANTKTFSGLTAGNYSVNETATPGWDFSGLNCTTTGGATVQTQGPSASISLDGSNQNVTCTYTNKQRGQIIVHKVTNPANDPTHFSITASGSGAVTNATRSISDGQTVTYDVSQGSYSVTEAQTNGWQKNDSDCAQLTVDSTDLTAECTIYNTKLAQLKIVKQTNPSKSLQKFSFVPGQGLSGGNFQLDTSNLTQTPNSKSFSGIVPGVYTVTEQAQAGWLLTGLSCTGVTYAWDNTTTLTVTVPAGGNVVCTFTNTELGSISGKKFEVSALGIPVDTVGGVTIQLKKGNTIVGSTVTDASGNYAFTNLLPDDYDIVEVLTGGWTQLYGDDTIHLSAGENEHNYFGNFKNATISGYKWSDRNGDGQKEAWEHKLPGWRMDLYKNGNYVTSTWTNWSGEYSFTDLKPGIYKVCEASRTGWVQTYPAIFDDCHHFIVFNSGENFEANFGNQARGSITVTKDVVNDNGGTLTADDFVLKVNGDQVASGDTNDFAAGHWYYIHESDPAKQGYEQTDVTCVDDNEHELGKVFWLWPGQNVSCTITNDDIAAQLTIVKYVYNGNTTLTKVSSDFTLNVDGTNVSDTAFPGSSIGTTVSLDAGDYAVSEQADSDYAATYSEDCTSTITIGESKTCYVTNTAIAKPEIAVKKDGPASAQPGDKVTYTFTVTNPGNVPLSGVSVSDDVVGNGAVLKSGDANSNTLLDPGETWVYSVDYVIPANQAGSVVNTVTVCGVEGLLERLMSERIVDAQEGESKVCATDTHTTKITTGHVLGDSTGELANTGQSPIVSIIAGTTIIMLAGATRLLGRKTQGANL